MWVVLHAFGAAGAYAEQALGYRFPERFGLITLVAKNIFDEKFNFQDTDPGNPSISPERLILFNFSLFF